MMFNMYDVDYISKKLGIDYKKFSKEDLLEGMNIEIEHGFVNPKTNVTNNDIEMTAKIALAHLNEFPNYYNKDYGLRKFEEFLNYKNQ